MRGRHCALLGVALALGCTDADRAAGDPELRRAVSRACESGVPLDEAREGIVELGRYAARHDATAELLIGLFQLEGIRIDPDENAGLEHIQAAEASGSDLAAGALGALHESGAAGLARDRGEAARWHRKAAEAGNSRSQQILGVYYQYGLLGEPDLKEAARWYRMSAEQGDPRGQTNLAYLYEGGEGVPEDLPQAIEWYKRAAAQYTDIAVGALGRIYTSGPIAFRNRAEGFRLLRQAAETDEAAQHNLAREFEDRGVNDMAMRYFERAANNGQAFSQFRLSLGYEEGRGIAKDATLAYKWSVLAATLSSEDPPRQRRDSLRQTLPPEAVARGQELADAWLAERQRASDMRVLPDMVQFICKEAVRRQR
jgi:TPR repeat protein